MLPSSAAANDNLNERAANGVRVRSALAPPDRRGRPCRMQRVAWRSPRCGRGPTIAAENGRRPGIPASCRKRS